MLAAGRAVGRCAVLWLLRLGFGPILEPGPRWVLDLALTLAAELALPFETTSEETWDGYTGPWSDHNPFVLAGVPIAYFETWNWSLGSPWVGQQTVSGDLVHTANDVYANVDPAQVAQTAELVAATVFAIASGEEPGTRVPGSM